MALVFSPCLARGRPPSWIRVPPLRSRLPRLPSSKMWTLCNSCWILTLREVPSRHTHASKNSMLRFICFPLALITLLSVWIVFFPYSFFVINFSLQTGACRSHVNTSSNIHNGLDLIFADIPENLPVPNISTKVPAWNKLHESYYEFFFCICKI